MLSILLAVQVGGVSIEDPGIRLRPFLEKVSQQTHQNLTCSNELANEVIATRFRDVPVEEIERQLAYILNASWSDGGGGLVLRQTVSQIASEIRWNEEERRTRFFSGIKKTASVEAGPEWTNADAKKMHEDMRSASQPKPGMKFRSFEELRPYMPTGHVASEICRVADFSKLDFAQTEWKTESFDSSKFGRIGISPGKVRQMKERYGREEKLLDSQYSRKGINPPEDGPFEFVVTISYENAMSAQLLILDHNGKTHGGDWLVNPAPSRDPNRGETFQVSELTNAIQQLYSNYDYGHEYREKRAKAEVWLDLHLGHATAFDPVGIYAGRCWLDFSRSSKRPLLASLAEEYRPFDRPTRCVPALQPNAPEVDMTRIDKDGWILGRPQNPWRNRAIRTDRTVIERLWASVKTRKDGDIERTADLMFLAAHPVTNGELMGVYPHSSSLSSVYGSLDAKTRRRAREGSICVEDLPAESQRLLEICLQSGSLNKLRFTGPSYDASTIWFGHLFPDGLKGLRFSCPQVSEWVVAAGFLEDEDLIEDLDSVALPRYLNSQSGIDRDEDFHGRVGHRLVAHPTVSYGSKEVREAINGPVSGLSADLPWKQMPKEFRAAVEARVKELDADGF